jgi:hypothetical protein
MLPQAQETGCQKSRTGVVGQDAQINQPRREHRMTQYAILGKLLQRKRGVTPMEIIQRCGTVCPHKRLSEMKAKGWSIKREQVSGATYGRYRGVAP